MGIRWRWFHWLRFKRPVLALQLFDQEVRFVVRQGQKVLHQGSCGMSGAVVEGGVADAEAFAQMLFAHVPAMKGEVAVLLSARRLHVHEISLPLGLDKDELDYQVARHITQHLGLSIGDVYFDWDVLSVAQDKRAMTVQIAVAHQADVAPFYKVFAESGWRMRWVCAEAQVLSRMYPVGRQSAPVVVCRVEMSDVRLWLMLPEGEVRSFYKRFDEIEIARAGFVYHAAPDLGGEMYIPTRFIADELAQLLPVWMADVMNRVTAVYVTGKGVDWEGGIPMIRARVGLPIYTMERQVRSDVLGSGGLECGAGMAILWHFSMQVNE